MTTQTATDEFAEFYSANFSRFAAQLYAYLGDHAEAQDLTQEAFCRAFDRWDRIRDYEHAAAWVRQVAWNLATSRLRHLHSATRYLLRQRPTYVDPHGPDRVDLGRALAKLPPNHRLAVVLHHLAQLSTSEIAQQRGVAEGTVRSWLSRGRSQLAEYYLDADAWQAPEFKPEGAQAAVESARKRRKARRTALVAVVLVLAVLTPLALAVLKRTAPPVIEPTKPPIVPTPQGSVEPRKLSLPGWAGQMPTVNFLDSRRGYSWQDTCLAANPAPGCGTVLVRTNDGALTWQQVPLPQIEPRSSVMVFETNHDTFTLEVGPEGQHVPTTYWFTNNGGVTWIRYPVAEPPDEALRALPRYAMSCADAPNFVYESFICDKRVLVDRHEKRVVAAQPPLQGRQSSAMTGADGRIWVMDHDTQSPRLVHSDDGAKTWREVPLPPKIWPHDPGHLELSPDGSQVWFVARSGLWQLVGQRWERRLDRSMDEGARLLGNDLWLMVYNEGEYRDRLAYFRDGQFTLVAELKDVMSTGLLADGTIVAHGGDGSYYLGTGTGMDRRWVHLTM